MYFLDEILSFINTWKDFLMFAVGVTAIFIYKLEKRQKVTEAAALIIQQIDELQEMIPIMQSYIYNGQLNETGFYESRPLIKEDYWDKYKHLFVKDMDKKSYRIFNTLYDCVVEIQEQQQLMKELQRNHFFITQKVVNIIEAKYICDKICPNENHNVNYRKIIDEIMESIPKTVSDDSRDYLKNIIDMIDVSKCSFNVERFFKEYRGFDTILINIICNNNGITKYTPLQIKLSLEKALKQYELLEVSSCLGYQKLVNISHRKI